MSSNVYCNQHGRQVRHPMKFFSTLVFLASLTALPSTPVYAGEAKPTASGDWEKTVEAAKREGKVVVSVPASAELRKGIEKNFKQRFAIEARSEERRVGKEC